MAKITLVDIKGRNDVKVWLDVDGPGETLIYVAVAIGNGIAARRAAEEAKNREMLILRQSGCEMPEGFKPEKTYRKIDGMDFQVTMYKFVESDWKKGIMKGI